jgi:hypothetical protein
MAETDLTRTTRTIDPRPADSPDRKGKVAPTERAMAGDGMMRPDPGERGRDEDTAGKAPAPGSRP